MTHRSRVIKTVPNAITALRICAIPLLVWLCFDGNEPAFAVIVTLSFVGDILDGLLARWLGAVSALGAALDTIADTLLLSVAALGAWIFFPDEVRAHAIPFGLVAGLWLIEKPVAILRYGRLASFHTYSSRAAAYAMGFFLCVWLLFSFSEWLMYLAVGLAVASLVEQFVLMWLLPHWVPDVRGAIWVWRNRSAAPR